MKVLNTSVILALVALSGCTTGSKVKHTVNYYSVGEYRSVPVPLPTPQLPTIYNVAPPRIVYVSQEPTITDLGKEITRKIYRKMQAAYSAN